MCLKIYVVTDENQVSDMGKVQFTTTKAIVLCCSLSSKW